MLNILKIGEHFLLILTSGRCSSRVPEKQAVDHTGEECNGEHRHNLVRNICGSLTFIDMCIIKLFQKLWDFESIAHANEQEQVDHRQGLHRDDQ